MNGHNFLNIIASKKPRYYAKYQDFVYAISQKGDTTGKGEFSTFGAFYQTFMYAYIVGLRLGKKEYLSPDEDKVEFAPISLWKPVEIRDFILMTLMNRCDEFKVKWDWLGLENATEDNLNNFAIHLMRELEAYANSGFEYLKNKWDNERILFNNPFVFVQLLEELPIDN